MFLDLFSAQRLAAERMKDALREVERRRLARAVAGRSRGSRQWTPKGPRAAR